MSRDCPFPHNDFLVEEMVLEGAGGTFYRAQKTVENIGRGRPYLLYLGKPLVSKDVNAVDLLRTTAQRTEGATYPGLLSLLSVLQTSEGLSISSEFIPGCTLATLIERLRASKERWPIPAALFLAGELAKCLSFLHEYSDPATGNPLAIVHERVSPETIFISYGGQAKLIHPCMAKMEWFALSGIGGFRAGMANYGSPEQALGRDVDGRTDYFSLGVLLWELLAGRPLYGPMEKMEWLKILTEKDPPPPSQVNGEVPSELDTIVKKLLDRDMFLRYELGKSLISDFTAVMKFRLGDYAAEDFSKFSLKHLGALKEEWELRARGRPGGEQTKTIQSDAPAEVTQTQSTLVPISLAPAPSPTALRPAVGIFPVEALSSANLEFGGTSQLQHRRARAMALNHPGTQLEAVFAPANPSKFYGVLAALLLVLSAFLGPRLYMKLRKSKHPASVQTAGQPGTLHFVSTERGWVVEVNGNLLEINDDRVSVPSNQPLEIRVHKPGFDDQEFQGSLGAKEEVDVSLEFKPSAR